MSEKVEIFLKNKFHFSGILLSDENGFVKIRDKFGKIQEFNRSEISQIKWGVEDGA